MILLPSAILGNLLNCNMKRANSTAVVTAERRIEPVALFETLLDDAVKSIERDDRFDNFILFVHGRGQHPCHAFDKKLIADLESDYSAKVIMYHWPSWEGVLGFPDKNARQSAKDLKAVIGSIAAYRDKHKERGKKIKFTLFTHSMGSIVLEEVMLNEGGDRLSNVFDTVVINASCSAGENHAKWVDKIRLSDHIYIVINQHDPTLGKAEMYEEWRYRDKGWRLLGKALVSKDGVEYALADNSTYIDVSRFPLRHVYYLHRYLKKSPAVKSFYDRALNGIPAKLDKAPGLLKIERERVYILE